MSTDRNLSEISNDSNNPKPDQIVEEKKESEPESTEQSLKVELPSVDENKLLRKIDLHVVPIVTLLYLLSYIDRSNIVSQIVVWKLKANILTFQQGNAKIEGLDTSLGLTASQYNWCLTVFFFTYAPFEIPCNIILKKMRPSIWLPSTMVGWGIVMICMGFVKGYSGLIITRLFLGITEAGLKPGVIYYLSRWYRRNELQFRVGLFQSAGGVAGAFSGLLAYAISFMHGKAGESNFSECILNLCSYFE